MRSNLYCLLFSLSTCLCATPAGATVTVAFINPDSYSDTGRLNRELDTAMREIESHLKYLGGRYLPSDRLLKIEVLDVDLAGRPSFSSRLWPDTRILRGRVDWPSIKLHYVLESGGRVLEDRQESVRDMDYLQRIKGKYANQSFPYEKQMLEDWFKHRFAEDKPARN